MDSVTLNNCRNLLQKEIPAHRKKEEMVWEEMVQR